ncbi:MAG: peptidyl-prolyl cis-trans isomerase [Bacillota bacterium]|nr:peptidyl-prolyl cis-trans isomerase [Bacillota bacterium]
MPKRAYQLTVYFFVILLLMILMSGCADPVSEKVVVARVNDEDIGKKEVQDYLNLIYLYIPGAQEIYSQKEYADILEEDIIWALIRDKITRQEVERLGLFVNEEKIEQDFLQERAELIKDIYGSEEVYNSRLKELGLNENYLKKMNKNAYLSQALYEHVGLNVTEEEAMAFVEGDPGFWVKPAQVYVFQILVETKEEARNVHTLLMGGADFVAVGEKYSMDSNIELGHISEQDMRDPLFLETAFSLEPGEISEPVEMSYGYYIIKITEKDESRDSSFEEVKDEAMEFKKREYFEQYVQKLIQDANIETFKN